MNFGRNVPDLNGFDFYNLRYRILVGWSVCLALACHIAGAQDLDLGLPGILSHSETKIDVPQGALLELGVRIASQEDSVRWLRNEGDMCQFSRCKVETSAWPLGLQKIQLIVANSSGYRIVDYEVRIIVNRDLKNKKTIRPREVPYQPDGNFMRSDDLYGRVMSGAEKVYRDSKPISFGRLPRRLTWTEQIKPAKKTMFIGRPGSDEHMILAGAVAELWVSKEGRRGIDLMKGTIRSRNIRGSTTPWSVMVGDWLQVDGDTKADVVVERIDGKKDTMVRVTSVRGAIKVTYKAGDKVLRELDRKYIFGAASFLDKSEENEQEDQYDYAEAEDPAPADEDDAGSDDRYLRLKIPPGGSMEFSKAGRIPLKVKIPPSKRLYNIFKATTPYYLRPKYFEDRKVEAVKDAKDGKPAESTSKEVEENPVVPDTTKVLFWESFEYLVSEADLPTDFDRAMEMASRAINKRDYMLALEYILPYADQLKRNYFAALYAARAYRGLHNHKLAYRYYRYASKANRSSAEPFFQIGLMSIEAGKWKTALKWFDKALDRGHSDWQAGQYYMGVASYRRGEIYSAQSHFKYSLWEKKQSHFTISAQKFLMHILEEKVLDLWGRLGVQNDSNILRLNPNSATPGAITTRSGMGYVAEGGISGAFFRLAGGQMIMGYDIKRRDYFASDLKDIAVVDQIMYLKTTVNMGGVWGIPFSLIDIKLFLHSFNVGEERAADGIGMNTLIDFPGVIGSPKLRVDASLYLDPLPARDDMYDPIMEEVVVASDRSMRFFTYALGFTALRSDRGRLNGTLFSTLNRHRNELVRVDDYNEFKFGGDYQYQPTPSFKFDVGLSYGTRTFNEADDKRKDSFMDINGNAKWYWSSFFYTDFWTTYRNNNSSRETNKFTRSTYGAGAALEF